MHKHTYADEIRGIYGAHASSEFLERQKDDFYFASFHAIEATDTLCHYHGIFAFIFFSFNISFDLFFFSSYFYFGDANAAVAAAAAAYTIKRKSYTADRWK